MNQCLICGNKTQKQDKFQSICSGCLSLLFHPKFDCKRCGVELYTPYGDCGSCMKSPPAFSSVHYACTYQAPVDKWVKSLKFGKNIIISRLFAEMLLPWSNQIEKSYALMPVPLHRVRLRSRGYNQAYEIAKELAKLSDRLLDTSLIRNKNTAMQAQLKLNQRAKNVSEAFAVTKTPINTLNKKIILVDDVMTSGNTLKECAKTLLKAGVSDVKVLVFARKSL